MKTIKELNEFEDRFGIHVAESNYKQALKDVLKLIDKFGDSHNDCCLALINILKSKIEG